MRQILVSLILMIPLGYGSSGCLAAILIGTDPEMHPYSTPENGEPHANVRLERLIEHAPTDRTNVVTEVATQRLHENDGIIRIRPGAVRWKFDSQVVTKDQWTSTNTCNLSHQFAFDAGRDYHLVYKHTGPNQCVIVCTDGAGDAPCKEP